MASPSAAAFNLRYVAIQTIVPTKMTPPGSSRQLNLPSPLQPETLQSRFRIVLYYKRKQGDETTYTLSAWIKESLAEALNEQPMLAGRLRKVEEGNWEVKYNDGGVRLVQAIAEMSVEEVLEVKEREGMEEQLCFWQDVDAENPNFSALFFVQVTEFQGDGYSIGISCNLLLADPLFFANFLKKWTVVHNQMLAQGRLSKTSMFHLDYFNKSRQSINIKPRTCNSSTTANTTTILFKANAGVRYDSLIARCVKETPDRLEGREISEFSVFVSDLKGNLEVNSFTKDGLSMIEACVEGAMEIAWRDELGLEEMALTGGKPVHVSYCIVSSAEQGLVVATMTSSGEEGGSGLMVSVTVPNKS